MLASFAQMGYFLPSLSSLSSNLPVNIAQSSIPAKAKHKMPIIKLMRLEFLRKLKPAPINPVLPKHGWLNHLGGMSHA